MAGKPMFVIDTTANGLGTLASVLAQNKYVVYSYATTNDDALKQAPYRWAQGDLNATAINAAEFVGKQLAKGKAEYAGDDAMKSEARKFGVIAPEQLDVELFQSTLKKKYGVTLATPPLAYTANGSPLGDPAKAQAEAPTVVEKLKAAGVTTVIMFTDVGMGGATTKYATTQDYKPEWVTTGFVYQDLALLGRASYDQDQWNHAFGISVLWPLVRGSSVNRTLMDWYWGPNQATTAIEHQNRVAWLAGAIHYAGPNLTPKTVQQGLFATPAVGGSASDSPTGALTGYGRAGGLPYDSYAPLGKDFGVVWYDSKTEGESQVFPNVAPGVYWYLNERQAVHGRTRGRRSRSRSSTRPMQCSPSTLLPSRPALRSPARDARARAAPALLRRAKRDDPPACRKEPLVSSPITSVNSSADLQTVDHPSIPQTTLVEGSVTIRPADCAVDAAPVMVGFLSDLPFGRGGVTGSLDPIILAFEDAMIEGRLSQPIELCRHARARPSVREWRLCGGGVPGARRPGMFDRPVDRRHQQRGGVARRHQRGARPVHHDGGHHDVRRRVLLLAAQRRSLRGGGDRRGVPRRIRACAGSMLTGEGTEGDVEYRKFFEEQASLYGLEIIETYYFPNDPTDDEVDAELERFRSLEPDALAYVGFGINTKQFGQSLKRIGWDPPRAMNTAILWAFAGGEWAEALEGWVGIDQTNNDHDDVEPNRNYAAMIDRFEKRFGDRRDSTMTALFYDQGRSAAEAIINGPSHDGPGLKAGLERIAMMPSTLGGPRHVHRVRSERPPRISRRLHVHEAAACGRQVLLRPVPLAAVAVEPHRLNRPIGPDAETSSGDGTAVQPTMDGVQ